MNQEHVREKMFEERLQAIHARSHALLGESSVDTSREEMLAMFDSFLGADFDSSTKERVIGLQQNLHRGQSLLAKQLEQRVLTEAEYVDRFNNLVAVVFEACEKLLGVSNFEALFGAPRAEMQGYIDKDTFVASRGLSSATIDVSAAIAAANSAFDSMTKAARQVAEISEANYPVPPKRHDLTNQTVLIVEGSTNYRGKLRGALQRAGYHVLQAESGWAALEMLNSHRPDLMVVDIKMPTMSGFELVDVVHRRPKTANVRIIMIASKILETTSAEAVSAGAEDVFMKSTEAEELVSKIVERLRNIRNINDNVPTRGRTM